MTAFIHPHIIFSPIHPSLLQTLLGTCARRRSLPLRSSYREKQWPQQVTWVLENTWRTREGCGNRPVHSVHACSWVHVCVFACVFACVGVQRVRVCARETETESASGCKHTHPPISPTCLLRVSPVTWPRPVTPLPGWVKPGHLLPAASTCLVAAPCPVHVPSPPPGVIQAMTQEHRIGTPETP